MTRSAADSTEYDLIVLGAGAVGENVADRAVQGGLTAVLVEHELVGGECSYWACMPSKALLRSGAGAARRPAASPAPPRRSPATLDVPAVLARRDSFTNNWNDDGQVRWVDGAGIALVRGHGRITGPEAGHGHRAGRHDERARPRGTPWPWPPAPTRSSRTSRACGTRSRGPAGRRPAPRACRPASPSSAAAWSPPRWPPPTQGSARRSP